MIPDQGVHGLPDGPVSGENLLEGWASKQAVRRDGKGKRQKLVVESFITSKCTLSNIASAVAKTDKAFRTVGSTGPD